MAADVTRIGVPEAPGGAPLRIHHSGGAFAPTPASRVALAAIVAHADRIRGRGLDWGSGAGLLAIGAARLAGVERVVGLEIEPQGVAAARANARRNGVADRVRFVESDSYRPRSPAGRRTLAPFRGSTDFMIANPPSSSPVGDGFGFRRVVVRGAGAFLKPGAALLLSVSSQYGMERVRGLLPEAPGLRYEGVAATSPWTPFDLGRPDLLEDLATYARAEERGGLGYQFRDPGAPERALSASAALAAYRARGESPLTRWQSLLFVRGS